MINHYKPFVRCAPALGLTAILLNGGILSAQAQNMRDKASVLANKADRFLTQRATSEASGWSSVIVSAQRRPHA